MNILAIISALVCIASLIALVRLILKKFPVLASIKLSNEKGEIAIRAKQLILEQRVQRKAAHAWQGAKKKFMPLLGATREYWGRLRGWAEEVERRYQENLESELQKRGESSFITPEACLAEAERLAVAGDESGAEQMAVKAIALDQKYLLAYKLLARLYAGRKEYNHVREIDEFLLHTDPHQADVYADLSQALIALGQSDLALDAIEKAVIVEENNPKYLDQLLELAILRKQKRLAADTLEKLKDANPENEKIPLFESRIQAIVVHKGSTPAKQ